MPPKGKQGGSTSSVEYSPARSKRIKARKAAQERRWAALAGPVEVRQVPVCSEPSDQVVSAPHLH